MLGNNLIPLSNATLAKAAGFVESAPGVSVTLGLDLGHPVVSVSTLSDYGTSGVVNWLRLRSGRWKPVVRRS